ncbi:hypothetical protein O181_055370 [Austropuccinia psidii MF-1]|uniref:RNA polymerase-associated protein LEO1 n=1 Tax=Austropuccinia psidii MF-1 TaxID=1389203 RepID=A0A9Q3E468_9BASI|nr:hypothetical protein [Austropuccinia psidii MF-1]
MSQSPNHPAPSVEVNEDLQPETNLEQAHQSLSEPEGEEDGDPKDDLFGGDDDDDVSNKDLADNEPEDPQRSQRHTLEYDEETEPHPTHTRSLHVAEAPLPNLPFPKSFDRKHWDLRLPHFLNLEPSPFTDQQYLESGDGFDKEDETDTSRLLAHRNVIRWRWQQSSDGQLVKQSNARVICWSDGSQSLQVGSELFDMVYAVDSRIPVNSNNPSEPVQGLTYLFAQHSEFQLLEAQSSITGQITLRPYTLNSLTHRALVANRSFSKSQSQRLTQTKVVTIDPEKRKIVEELEEAKKLKEHKKMESKLARQNSRQSNALGSSFGGKGIRKRRFNAPLMSDEAAPEEDYEEMDDDNEEEQVPDQTEYGGGNGFADQELSELEIADQKIEEAERQERADRLQKAARLSASSAEPKTIKRKLIIASDDDD